MRYTRRKRRPGKQTACLRSSAAEQLAFNQKCAGPSPAGGTELLLVHLVLSQRELEGQRQMEIIEQEVRRRAYESLRVPKRYIEQDCGSRHIAEVMLGSRRN